MRYFRVIIDEELTLTVHLSQPALGDIYESLVTMVQTEFDERGARLIEETQNKHQVMICS